MLQLTVWLCGHLGGSLVSYLRLHPGVPPMHWVSTSSSTTSPLTSSLVVHMSALSPDLRCCIPRCDQTMGGRWTPIARSPSIGASTLTRKLLLPGPYAMERNWLSIVGVRLKPDGRGLSEVNTKFVSVHIQVTSRGIVSSSALDRSRR